MSLLTNPKKLEYKTLSEGQHKGEIKGVQKIERSSYEYIEFTIDVPDAEMTIKHSISFNVSFNEDGNPKSQLAIFLKALGFDITMPIDLDTTIGKKFVFMSKNKIVGDSAYPRIINETVMLNNGA